MQVQTVVLVCSVVGLACTLFGGLIGFLTFNRNRDKDVKSDASEFAVIKTNLNTISSGIDSIRIDIKANERQMAALGERVTRVEESNKSLHKRIDKIEGDSQ